MSLTQPQVLGMYLGQRVIIKNKEVETLIEVSPYVCLIGTYTIGKEIYKLKHEHRIENCKLILRPFESMTDEEMSRFNSYYKMEVDTKNHYKLTPKSIGYLISIGIDVFNLRERGWAIYESDLKGENNERN